MQNLTAANYKSRSSLSTGSFSGRSPARPQALIWLALAVGFYLAAVTGFAASLTWGVPTTMSGDTDVNTNGTALYAYARGITTGTTNVNGVTFVAVTGHATWGGGNITFSANFQGDLTPFATTNQPFAGLSTPYQTVLKGCAYGDVTSGTVTLNNLIPGHSYAVQVWAADTRTNFATRVENIVGGNTVTLAYNVTHAAGGLGQYTIGNFVANSTSQVFTLTSTVEVQLNAINLRDVGVYAFNPARVNLAKYQPVITDSTNGTQSAAYITQGFVTDNSGWMSDNSGPHWAGVTFPFPVSVGSAQLAMGLNNASPMTVFYFQYLTNGNWVTVPGSTVVGNTNVERNIVFSSAITSTSFRVYDSLDSPIRIRQLALYPPNGTNSYPFGTDFSIDLARKQPAFATANAYGNWPLLASDGLVSPASTWQTTLVGSNALLINLQFTNKIGSAHLYSGGTGVTPLTNFVLQYWTGSAWANISGGSVSGNSSTALVIPFTTPVTTTKVQLVFTNSGVSAVQELCIFPANSNGGYPLGTGIVSNTPVTAKYDTYSDSYYYLSNSVAGKVVMESNGVPVLGTAAVTNWTTQYQVLLNYDNGTYRLINRNTGLCLAGAQLTTNAGVALVEEDYSALPDQEWYLQAADSINFYLVNQFSGLVLDTQGGALVQNVQANSATQLFQIPLAQIFPKKGVAGSWGNYPVTFDANWTYGWWYGPDPNAPSVNYYPMDPDTWYRGSTVAGNLWTLQPGWRTANYSLNVMGFNEPDHVDQANIDPTNGAIYWMNDQNLDLPLAGPAAADVNGTWNKTFYGYITNWGCRVDYLPAHEYPGNNSSGSSSIWINPMQTAYNTYGIPMWLTEFSIVDWSGTTDGQVWTEEDNYTALAEFIWRAESVTWLRKYSLYLWRAGPGSMATEPWIQNTAHVTAPPISVSYDTNSLVTPFGELYAGWDCDANVETNKVYYIYNSGTRKNLANMLDPQLPDAKSILVRDTVTKWTLQPTPTAGLYYLVSALDGRRLSYNGTSVTLVAPGTTGTAVQWSLTSYQYGWYYLEHPATSKRLTLAYNNSTFTAAFSMVANTTTGTAVQWRFIVPYTPVSTVWTGSTNASWVEAANWNATMANPSVNQEGNYALVFNSLSTNNLNTMLKLPINIPNLNNFTVYSLMVSNPAGLVSITATNTLVIGNGIDLSGASQDLTINTPLFICGQQGYSRHFWSVTNARTLSLNASVGGVADLIIAGGGTVSLGGTNTYTGSMIINTAKLTISGSGQLGNGNYAATITDNGAFNYNSSASQIVSGNISGTGSLVVNGLGALTLSGTNTYTGNTTVSGGKLALTGNSSLASTNVIVAGGATFDVSGETSTFALSSGCTLMNSSVGAVLNGNANCSLGLVLLLTDGVNPSLIQTNGTMTLSTSTLIKVNNTGTTLTPGKYPLIAAATAGNLGKVAGTLPTVTVSGNGASGTVSLQTNGTGGLDLVVTSTVSNSPTSLNFALSGSTLLLTWPGDHLGWIAQSNTVNLGSSNYWFDILGSQSATNLTIQLNPAATNLFFRLRYPL